MPSAVGTETRGSLGLDGQPDYLKWQALDSVREPVLKRRKKKESRTPMGPLASVLVHRCADLVTHIHRRGRDPEIGRGNETDRDGD